MIPATISPITGGCPRYLKIAPSTRAVMITTARASSTRSSVSTSAWRPMRPNADAPVGAGAC